MRRQTAGLLWLVALATALASATATFAQEERLEQLPMYEDQLAGVQLGWHGWTITGLWDVNGISPAQSNRLRRTYRMPDHIIMRLGTRMPLAVGSGSADAASFTYYFNPFDTRGGSAAGGGGGGPAAPGGGGSGGIGPGGPAGGPPTGPPGAGSSGGPPPMPGMPTGPPGMGQGADGSASRPWTWAAPTAEELQRLEAKFGHAFVAEAQGRPPSQIASPATSAMPGGAPIGPPGGMSGPGLPPGGPGSGGGGLIGPPGSGGPGLPGGSPFGGGGGGFGGGGGGTGLNLDNVNPLAGPFPELDEYYLAPRSRIVLRVQQLVDSIQRLLEQRQRAFLMGNDEEADRVTTRVARELGLLLELLRIAGLSDLIHVYGPGQPGRDIVFHYEPAPDIWVSIGVNFYLWQVSAITVGGNRPWGGAVTSPAPDGTPGIKLGDSLERIFDRYGWPDGWESFLGRYLLVHYYNTNNVGFVLDHPSEKVWRVIRMVIEPRPEGKERQMAGVQLGLNAQKLLDLRTLNGRPVYGVPYAIERPSHRISVVAATPEPGNMPPGILLDRRLGPVIGAGGGGAAGGPAGPAGPGGPGGPGGSSGAIGPPGAGSGSGGAPPIATGGSSAAAVGQAQGGAGELGPPPGWPGAGGPGGGSAGIGPGMGPGVPGEAGIPGGPPTGQSGGATGTGGASGATTFVNLWPIPFYFASDAMNVEAFCLGSARYVEPDEGGGAAGAGGAPGGPGGGPPIGPPGAAGGSASATAQGVGQAQGGAGELGPPPGWQGGGGGGGMEAPAGPGAMPGPPGGGSGAMGGPGVPGGPGIGGPGGAGGGGGDRAGLAAVLSEIYNDPTGQVGRNIAYGCRSSTSDCRVDICIEETEMRWDYGFDPDVAVEFGLDADGLCTQIGVIGTRWGGARTQRGIGLADNIGLVLLRYGPPFLLREFVQDVAERDPNVSLMSYATDDRGTAYGNLNFTLQNQQVTAIQIVKLGQQ